MKIHIKFACFPSDADERTAHEETFVSTASLFVQNRLQKSTSSFSNRSLICLTWISWLAEMLFHFLYVMDVDDICCFSFSFMPLSCETPIFWPFSGQSKFIVVFPYWFRCVCVCVFVCFIHLFNAFSWHCLTKFKRSLPHFNGFFVLSTNLRLCFYRPSICRFGNTIATIRQIQSPLC